MVSSEEGQGAPESVTSMIAETYDIGRVIDCEVLSERTNAAYLVTVEKGRYVLKVYAPGERSPDDLGYEVDLLRHLARKGVTVGTPIATRDGRFTGLLRTIGGDRPAILYTYAPGAPPPWPPDPAYYRPYGRAVAAIHAGLDDFISAHPRAPRPGTPDRGARAGDLAVAATPHARRGLPAAPLRGSRGTHPASRGRP